MDGYEDILGLFLDEAEQLLADLEDALLALEVDPQDLELVGRVFRALHTLKGAGSMYGLDRVSSCAHSVESLFDQVRKGIRVLDPATVAIGLRACDCLGQLVRTRESDEACEAADGLAHDIEVLTDVAEFDAVEELDAIDSGEAAATYEICIRPRSDAFRRGLRLVGMLTEIDSLGEAVITCDTGRIPPLTELDPTECYMTWWVILETDAGRDAIDEALLFLMPEEWEIKELRAPLGAEPGDSDLVAPARSSRTPGNRSKVAASTKSLRVSTERLDELVDLIGELVTVQAGLAEVALQSDDARINEMSERIERVSHSLRSSVLTIRMVPVGTLFNRFRRLVRDLGVELGKQADVVMEGGDTELDKSVIDRIEEPLLHIVRNCLSHGIEAPDARLEAGKSAAGTVHLSAYQAGGNVYIRVADDGRGIDLARVREQAVEAGLVEADAPLSTHDALQLLCMPGFSTATEVTSVSGRGVGLDVVKRTIEDLQGSLELEARPGEGAVTTMRLPLTLAVVEGLLVESAHERYVLPLAVVEECVELTQQDGWRSHDRNLLQVRDELIPFTRLRTFFEIDARPGSEELAVIVRNGDVRFGVVVDRVIDRFQTVVKTLGRAVRRTEGVSGATVLGDGSLALIIDVGQLASALAICDEAVEA